MPTKVFIDVNLCMPEKLEKDLLENEIICPTCNGLGVVVRDNVYGLQGEPWIKGFPYKKQSLWACPDCYNGVAKVCSFCGKIGDKRYVRAENGCNCEKAAEGRRQKERQKCIDRWNKAEKISINEAFERFEYIYLEDEDEYLPVDEFKEYLEVYQEKWGRKPEYIYGTNSLRLSLYASDIVESRCEDLHEDAYDSIGDDQIAKLQQILDQWCEEAAGGTISYEPNFSIGIYL